MATLLIASRKQTMNVAVSAAMFSKVLIANRGEIACRVLRTCRRLGIRTVAIYSDADQGALHTELADEAVRIGPAPVKESYLQIEAVVAAAKQTGAEGIHPGYGLLSERSAFARAVAAAGVVFIGPPPEVLDALGDKMKARHVAKAAGVASVPGLDEPLPLDDASALPLAREHGDRIGYPIIIKAVGGGGGIGMQIVDSADKLERAMKTCADRARSAFGDARVYLERYIASPKHIEVQGLADGLGGVMSLGERECSVQRRHQKIVEESPSPAPFFRDTAGSARRTAVEEAALKVFRHAGYVGAGTCEFIVGEDGQAFFLEVNARLQVEHPVTEMCTGVDLVEQQLRIAAGDGWSPALAQGTPVRRGHSVEVRLYAEDPAKSFAPQPGKLAKLVWPETADDLRVETGFRQGDTVTPFYDPLLAKIVAHGASRDKAIDRLDRALAATEVELLGPKGPAQTNLAFLRKVLSSGPFREGRYDTHFAEVLAKEK
jgi:acetyl-CoA carboxylase biotin carboxylase subunit/3-methylcrotonyl-CoA carboxylase alpha subunit